MLTASVVPSLLGLGFGADEAFERLLGLAPPLEDNEHLQRGRRLEPKAAALFARRTGFSLEETGLWKREVAACPRREPRPPAGRTECHLGNQVPRQARGGARLDHRPSHLAIARNPARRLLDCDARPPALDVYQLYFDSDLAELLLLARNRFDELKRPAPASEKSLPFLTPVVRRDLKTALKQTRDGYLRPWG